MFSYNEAARAVVRFRGGVVVARFRSLEQAMAKTSVRYLRYESLGSWEHDEFGEASSCHYGLVYADGGEISREEFQEFAGPRKEDEHALYRGQGPVRDIGRRGSYRYYRHPETQGNRRTLSFVDVEAGEPKPRAKQSANAQPDAWDDFGRTDSNDRSWKRQRKTQWK